MEVLKGKIKHINGSLHLNFHLPILIFRVKYANSLSENSSSSSFFSSSLQLQVFSFKVYLLLLFFLDAENVFSKCDVPSSFSILISYAIRIPCNSSMLRLVIFDLSSNANTLGLNHVGKVLRIFQTTIFV